MAMSVVQVRLPDGLTKEMDRLVKKGYYATRSDVVRDSIRKMILDKMVGIIPNTGDSVKEVRQIRKKLSKEKFDLDEINKLAE